jgi:DNA-nicking Smr family endonuclease
MSINELDLHGYIVQEAMEIFITFYNDQVDYNKNTFKVIHGYGSNGTGGKIRAKLRNFLYHNQDKVAFIPIALIT